MSHVDGRALPGRRGAGAPYRIAVVCLGNICRSPIAEVVLSERIAQAGLSDRVEVVSAGTGDWHVGEPMDQRAADVLGDRGYDTSRHRARQFDPVRHQDMDLVLAMDATNHTELSAMRVTSPRLRMFRDFDPLSVNGEREVPDPYFGGADGFDSVLAMVERTAAELVALLSERLRED